jgi:hypothetical protein
LIVFPSYKIAHRLYRFLNVDIYGWHLPFGETERGIKEEKETERGKIDS